MTRLRLRAITLCARLSLGLLTASAVAAPALLERVPNDAMVVLTIPSPRGFEKSISDLRTAAEIPFPVPGLEDLLAQNGITGGVDLDRAFAVILFPPAPDAPDVDADADADAENEDEIDPDLAAMGRDDEPPAVMLVPVSDYAELVAGFGVQPGAEANAIDQIELPDGDPAFMRNLGDGYALIADTRELLARFEGPKGNLTARLGKAGTTIAENAQVTAIINMETVRPFVPEMMEKMHENFEERAATMGMAGAGLAGQQAATQWLVQTLATDAQVIVAGLRTGGMGVGLDVGATFNEGSTMAKVFSAQGKTKELLAKLPNQPFLLAGAMDTSSPALKAFMQQVIAKAREGQPDVDAELLENANNAIAQSDGYATVIGLPQGGLFGGVLSSTVAYTAGKDPAALAKTTRDSFANMTGLQKHEGVTLTSDYKENALTVADTQVDAWSLTVNVDPESEDAMQLQQGMQMMFDPGGMNGYIAKAEDGIYYTYAKNSDLLASALKAGKGQGETFTKNQLVGQVGEQLPGNRIVEGYVGTKSVLDLFLPFAAMMGVQVPPDAIPENLPPIGGAMSASDGSAHLAVFVPAPVIKTGAKVGMAVAGQMGGMGDGEDFEDEMDDSDEGTGQPKF